MSETITPVEMNALIKQAKQGDKLATDKVILSYLPLVRKAASRFNYELREDSVQNGVLGLYRAIETFNEESATFGTYAYFWVYHYISNEALDYHPNESSQIDVTSIPGDLDVESDVIRSLMLDKLYTNILRNRSPKVKKTLERRLKEGVNLLDIAKELGVTKQSISQTLIEVTNDAKRYARRHSWN